MTKLEGRVQPRPPRVIAAFWVALAGAAAWNYARDCAGRDAALAFAREWRFDVRRPAEVEQVLHVPSADLAAEVMAGAAVDDEIGSVRWDRLSAAERDAWLNAFEKRDGMLEAAHGLALSAVAANPGFGIHAFRVGQLAYLSGRRKGAAALKAGYQRWAVPLERAIRLAPGFDAPWAFLGAAAVETWPLLSDEARAESLVVLRRAFLDPEVARRLFLPVSTELGRGRALDLLPEVPGPLAAARRQVEQEGDVAAAAAIQRRWERAEARARAADLARLEERARLGDEDGLRTGCRAFVAAHPPRERDTREGHREAARVLELWPHDRPGKWSRDGRAELLRYFLDGRGEGVDPEAIGRAAWALLDVPETEAARLALLAGDRYAWESVLRDSKTVGSLEWTTFFVELARTELAAGSPAAARETLERISPAAQSECAVLLARREWAQAAGNEAAAEQVERELRAAREAPTGPGAWSSSWSLPICVDPRADAGALLHVDLSAENPALVEWEVNGGRRGSFVVGSEGASIALPLDGLQGMAIFSLRILAGPRPAIVSASRQAAAAAPERSASVVPVAGIERLNSTSP